MVNNYSFQGFVNWGLFVTVSREWTPHLFYLITEKKIPNIESPVRSSVTLLQSTLRYNIFIIHLTHECLPVKERFFPLHFQKSTLTQWHEKSKFKYPILLKSTGCSCKANRLKLQDIQQHWALAYTVIKLNPDDSLLLTTGQKKQMILILHSLENMKEKSLPTCCSTIEKKPEPYQNIRWKYN